MAKIDHWKRAQERLAAQGKTLAPLQPSRAEVMDVDVTDKWSDEQHAAAIEALTGHKWLDPECGVNGCQSLVWKGRYEAAVSGRQGFRQAYRVARAQIAAKDAALRLLLREGEGSANARAAAHAALSQPSTARDGE